MADVCESACHTRTEMQGNEANSCRVHFMAIFTVKQQKIKFYFPLSLKKTRFSTTGHNCELNSLPLRFSLLFQGLSCKRQVDFVR